MTTPNLPPLEDDERGAGLGTKLFAESKIGADNQVIILGLVVLAVFVLGLGWQAWQGGSDELPAQAVAAVTSDDAEVDPAPVAPDLDGLNAVAISYGIKATNTGGAAMLTGVVDTEAIKTSAGSDALAVTGITSVDNRLKVIQPAVVAALSSAGVTEPQAIVDGTTVTVRGAVDTADEAAAAVEAAGAVDGVDVVIDELTILEDEAKAAEEAAAEEAAAQAAEEAAAEEAAAQAAEDAAAAEAQAAEEAAAEEAAAASTAAADLNALLEANPIQFATSSAVILDASFATLDEAATYLAELDSAFEVQGYTDVRGSEDANLALSQARAESVRQYLVDKGIAAERLTATGFGPTTQFGEGDSAEALAANRRVRFEAK